jgi:hypothetical protein
MDRSWSQGECSKRYGEYRKRHISRGRKLQKLGAGPFCLFHGLFLFYGDALAASCGSERSPFPPLRSASRSQTFTALMYSTRMFEERDVSLIVSVLATSNPDLPSRPQSCFSVMIFFPNPFGGFTR